MQVNSLDCGPMIDYPVLKLLHAALALVSVLWFAARGLAVLVADFRPSARLWRAGPHLVDTLLLVSGIWLALLAGWMPFVHPWLGTKLGLLVVYIGLAWVALKPWLDRRLRWSMFFAALGVFAWMMGVAFTKSPAGPLRLLGF